MFLILLFSSSHLPEELLELVAEEAAEHDSCEGAALGGHLGPIAHSAKQYRHLLLDRKLFVGFLGTFI